MTGTKSKLLIAGAFLLSVAAAAPTAAQGSPPAAGPDENGAVTLDGVTVPVSSLLSPEGQAYLKHLIVDQPFSQQGGPMPTNIAEIRAGADRIMQGFLQPMLKRYDVTITEERIGGVLTDVVVPAAGIRPENSDRVLINVHGGGFTTGARTASLVESVPLAALMGIKVVSIDYRMGPEATFPAGSEDVEAVYRELLKTYDPSKMVLYGCSAGGLLTAQALAWFDSKGLPMPAAAGVFCASLGEFGGGDSAFTAGPLNGSRPMPARAAGERRAGPPPGPSYLSTAESTDPLAYPVHFPDLLKRFPPVLFVTGSRSFEFSAALDSHIALSKAGGESQFLGWDGMFHGFFYNSELPESRDAYQLMIKFFDSHMEK